MPCAGVLLTGGASRRMGRDKSSLPAEAGSTTLAGRTAALLAASTAPTWELGPGVSGLTSRADGGDGPLCALAAAADLWAALPDNGHVVLLATDLPQLSGGFLRWLVAHPAPGALVPLDQGRLQMLSARYPVAALRRAAAVAVAGKRRLADWLAEIEPMGLHRAPPSEWARVAGSPLALRDVDTPEDLAALTAGAGRDRSSR